MKNLQKGFTLIELIIVICIIGILSSIVYPHFENGFVNINNNKVIGGYIVDSSYEPERCYDYECTGEHYVITVEGYDSDCEIAENRVKISTNIYDSVMNKNDGLYGLKTHYKKCKFKY